MYFDLYQLLVEQIVGGFWLSTIVIVGLIFLIMAVLGKMSKLTVTFYCSLFLFTMTIGFGYKWISTLIFFGILTWLYLEVRATTGG